jgi:hypothetical protein
MSQYDNTNRGAIWKNNDQRPNKNDPHFQGNINFSTSCPHCKQKVSIDHQLSAWKTEPEALKENPKRPLMSFSVRPAQQGSPEQPRVPEEPSAQPQQASAPTPPAQDVNDEIPF